MESSDLDPPTWVHTFPAVQPPGRAPPLGFQLPHLHCEAGDHAHLAGMMEEMQSMCEPKGKTFSPFGKHKSSWFIHPRVAWAPEKPANITVL